MKSLPGKTSRRTSGFSLLEMTIVLALIIVMASISFMSLQPVMRQQRITNSYNIVLSAMRQGRDNSVAQRTSYSVTLDSTVTPNTITVAPTFPGPQGIQNPVTYALASDVGFIAVSSIPTAANKTPDGFGTGAKAIDFGYTGSETGIGGQKVIYFCPDGSSQDNVGNPGQCTGNPSSGVVYIARAGELTSSRALTVWGATGRIRGWRLYTAGGAAWQRQ